MAHGHSHAQTHGIPPAPQPLPNITHIIAVGSGKGGVGKTTIAVNLALALTNQGLKVGLLDADIYGPNVPLMMASNDQPRVSEDGSRIIPNTAYGVKMISVGLLNPGINRWCGVVPCCTRWCGNSATSGMGHVGLPDCRPAARHR